MQKSIYTHSWQTNVLLSWQTRLFYNILNFTYIHTYNALLGHNGGPKCNIYKYASIYCFKIFTWESQF